MHATIRRYRGMGAVAGQVIPKVAQGLVPILRQSQGFAGYCAFAAESGDLCSISLFETRQAGDGAAGRAREWVQANLRDLIPDPPEVTQGEVVNQDLAKLQGAGANDKVFVRLNRYPGTQGKADEIGRRVIQDVLPQMQAQQGYRGFFNLLAEGNTGLAASFWQSRDAGNAWGEKFASALLPKLRDLLPNPPETMYGTALILETGRAAQRGTAA